MKFSARNAAREPKRSRPMYSVVRIYYDVHPEQDLDVGHFLQTQSRHRTTYFVESVRISPTRPERRWLRCLRWPPDQVPADATVWPLVWYPRKKKARRLM